MRRIFPKALRSAVLKISFTLRQVSSALKRGVKKCARALKQVSDLRHTTSTVLPRFRAPALHSNAKSRTVCTSTRTTLLPRLSTPKPARFFPREASASLFSHALTRKASRCFATVQGICARLRAFPARAAEPTSKWASLWAEATICLSSAA